MTDRHLQLVQTHENAARLALAREQIDAPVAVAASRSVDFVVIRTVVTMFTTYIMHMNNYHGSAVYEDVKRRWKQERQWFLENHTMGDFHDLLDLYSVVYRWMRRFNYAEKCYLVQYMLLGFQ
jgi:hypothetical protein